MAVKQFLTAIFILVMYKMARGFLRISSGIKKDYLSFYCKGELQ